MLDKMGGITQLFVTEHVAWPGRRSEGMQQLVINTMEMTTTACDKPFIAPPVLVVPLDQE